MASPPSWVFNFKFVTVRLLKSVEIRRRAKFGQNRSNCCRDIGIFRFFKMAAAAILDFLIFEILTTGTLTKVELRHLAKFRQKRSNRGKDVAIFRFFKMATAAMLDF